MRSVARIGRAMGTPPPVLAPNGRFVTKTDSVTEAIRNRILRGLLKPGTQLLQQDVAHDLGVSPTPVREAFGVLEAQGLVERRPHRGVVVADVRHDIEGTYELRGVLEVMAARRAAERADPVAIAELQALLDEGRRAMNPADLQRFRQLALRFHSALARASGSRAIVEATEMVLSRSFFNVPLDRKRMLQSQKDHVDVLAAIRRSDAKRAAAIASRHSRTFTRVALAAQKDQEKHPRGRRKNLDRPT